MLEHLTLAERLLLLAWDDERGKVGCGQGLAQGLAGALLLELLLRDAVVVEDGQVVARRDGAGDELLDQALTEIRAARRSGVQPIVERLAGKEGRWRPALLKRLTSWGILQREERRILGLFPVTRYPVAAPEVPAAVRQQVRDAVTTDVPVDDPRTAMLAGLAGICGLVDPLVPRSERRVARRRAQALADGEAVTDAVSKALRDVQAATMAAVTAVAATTAATAASSSNSC